MPDKNNLPAARDEPGDQKEDSEGQAIEAFLRSLPQDLREKIEALPPDGRGTLLEITASFTRGPYPPPEMLTAYKEILPDAPDRIFRIPERQQEIQAETNRGLLQNDRRRINGQIAIALGIIAVAGLATWLGNAVIALPLGLAGFVTLWAKAIGRMLAGKRRDDRNEKGDQR